MAISKRGGAPVTGTDSGGSATVSATCTGSFQPQAGDLLVIFHKNDFYALSNMPTPTVNGSTTGVAAITNGTADGGTNMAHIKSYTFPVEASGDVTVSVTETGSHDEEKALKVYVLIGANTADPVDVAGNTTGTSATQDAPSVSPATSDAYVIVDNNSGGGASNGSYTSGNGLTDEYAGIIVGSMSGYGGTKQLAASGATGAFDIDVGASIPYASVTVAIKTAAAAATAPPPRRRDQDMGVLLQV